MYASKKACMILKIGLTNKYSIAWRFFLFFQRKIARNCFHKIIYIPTKRSSTFQAIATKPNKSLFWDTIKYFLLTWIRMVELGVLVGSMRFWVVKAQDSKWTKLLLCVRLNHWILKKDWLNDIVNPNGCYYKLIKCRIEIFETRKIEDCNFGFLSHSFLEVVKKFRPT